MTHLTWNPWDRQGTEPGGGAGGEADPEKGRLAAGEAAQEARRELWVRRLQFAKALMRVTETVASG